MRAFLLALTCAFALLAAAMAPTRGGAEGAAGIKEFFGRFRSLSIRSNAQLNDSFVQTTIKTDYFPDQYTVIPHDGDKVSINGKDFNGEIKHSHDDHDHKHEEKK